MHDPSPSLDPVAVAAAAVEAVRTPASDAPFFDPRMPGRGLVEEVLALAARAPSGVNTQPWNLLVLAGDAWTRLGDRALDEVPALASDPPRCDAFWAAFAAHPLVDDTARQGGPEAADPLLWRAMSLPDAQARGAALGRYFRGYGAPVLVFCTLHRDLGLGAVLDVGMFAQNLLLAARTRGLRGELQTGWRGLAPQLSALLEVPAEHWLVFGIALGFDAARAAGASPRAVPASEAPATRIVWHR